jgi:hypothetical protein
MIQLDGLCGLAILVMCRDHGFALRQRENEDGCDGPWRAKVLREYRVRCGLRIWAP